MSGVAGVLKSGSKSNGNDERLEEDADLTKLEEILPFFARVFGPHSARKRELPNLQEMSISTKNKS